MNKGQAFIEVIIAMVIVGVLFTTFMSTARQLVRSQASSRDLIEATDMAQNGLEITFNFLKRNWDTAPTYTDPDVFWHPSLSGGNYTLAPNTLNVRGKYIQGIKIEPVYRDANGNVADSGTLDNNTLKITSRVELETGGLRLPAQLITYVTQ